jgi:hypothetical protein
MLHDILIYEFYSLLCQKIFLGISGIISSFGPNEYCVIEFQRQCHELMGSCCALF